MIHLLLLLVLASEPAVQEPPITAADREHWAFAPLRRPSVPAVKTPGWTRTPVDRFILARLEARGLSPAAPCDRWTLIRRATFDLTGLPPTPSEVDQFVADKSTAAYERLLDRLLGSPAYGERWAQHWLDLARFAETDGFEHDKVRPDAWKYRDWVIAALNSDMPYDEFAVAQIAGDTRWPNVEAYAVATGFALCGPDMPDINRQDERRHMLLNELTATVGSTFLGLQFGCAQCHDHKYDPISQADFYRLRAFFDNTELFRPSKFGRTLRERPSEPAASYVMLRGDFRTPGPKIEPAFPRIANPAGKAAGRSRAALADWLAEPDNPLATRAIVNRLWQHHFGAGLARTPSDLGAMGERPTHPELLDWLATELPRLGWSLKRMHRLLMMSAVYQLSSRLADGAPDAEWKRSLEADPDNELWGRRDRVRLEGEAIRDAMLAASERTNPKPDGPGVMPPLPAEMLSTLLKGQWETTADPREHLRRSVYLFVRRNLRYPIFEAFDRPDTNASCAERNRSTTAPQALFLLNSEFTQESARIVAGLALSRGTDSPSQVGFLYRQLFRRSPREPELQQAVEFLDRQRSLISAEGKSAAELSLEGLPSNTDPYAAAALIDLTVALFNASEFLYID